MPFASSYAGGAPSAFSVHRVSDINSDQTQFFPSNIAQFGSKVVFTAEFYDGYISSESEWQTNGTSSGTTHFSLPAAKGGFPTRFTPDGDKEFFVELYSNKGPELWQSDGTIAGTAEVKSFPENSDLISMVVLHQTLYFLLVTDYSHYALWESDGTSPGTRLVAKLPESVPYYDFYAHDALDGGAVAGGTAIFAGLDLPGRDAAFLNNVAPKLVIVGFHMFFIAGSHATGEELWISDGTPAGTHLVKDIDPGSDGSYPQSLMPLENQLLFVAGDGVHGRQVWESDGTAKGTSMITNILHENPNSLIRSGNRVFFVAQNACMTWSGVCHASNIGPALWVTDGTAKGTTEIKSTDNRTHQSLANFTSLSDTNSPDLLFTVNGWRDGPDKLPNGNLKTHFSQELWTSNGASAGTHMVKDIYPGNTSNIAEITVVPTIPTATAFFVAADGAHGRELWRTDGTTSGTRLVKDINPGPGSSNISGLIGVDLGGQYQLLFGADDGSHGPQLWSSAGTAQGTNMLKFINRNTASSNPYDLTPLNGGLDFFAQGPANPKSEHVTTNLYRVSGPASHLQIIPRPSGQITDFASMGTVGVYLCGFQKHAFDICRIGSSRSDTGFVTRVVLPANTQRPYQFEFRVVGAGDHVFILSTRRVWVTDGTPAGTKLIEILPNGSTDNWGPVATQGNTLYFTVERNKVPQQIWETNGAAAGTTQLAIPRLTQDRGYVEDMKATPRSLFISVYQPDTGDVFWLGNGTSGGMHQVVALRQATSMTEVGNRIFFVGDEGVHGAELWTSNGTIKGTNIVRDIRVGVGGSNIQNLTSYNNGTVNGAVLFSANDGHHGQELWTSDGTTAGTEMIADLQPGTRSSSPYDFTPFDDAMFFIAYKQGDGWSLFDTNGTTTGTHMVRPLLGLQSYQISHPTVAGGNLYFTAYDSAHGTELWVATPAA